MPRLSAEQRAYPALNPAQQPILPASLGTPDPNSAPKQALTGSLHVPRALRPLQENTATTDVCLSGKSGRVPGRARAGEADVTSSAGKMSIGVPIKVLHEAEGHIVTCETNTGEVYRGKLIEAEDNMNCQMANITVTYRDGRVAQLEQVYIRGSKIRFLILPDMLKNAPMLKSMKNKNQAGGAGRGKAAILKAQVAARGRGRGGPGRGNIFQKRR
ncbi:hypothetical protein AOLI_G00079890 [Acnodon oligacanthus]